MSLELESGEEGSEEENDLMRAISEAITNFPLVNVINCGMHICKFDVAIKHAQKNGHHIPRANLSPLYQPCTEPKGLYEHRHHHKLPNRSSRPTPSRILVRTRTRESCSRVVL
jgi:hypothetical protein